MQRSPTSRTPAGPHGSECARAVGKAGKKFPPGPEWMRSTRRSLNLRTVLWTLSHRTRMHMVLSGDAIKCKHRDALGQSSSSPASSFCCRLTADAKSSFSPGFDEALSLSAC